MSKVKRAAMVGTLLLVFFLLSLTLMNPGKALAVDAFLKVDGIEGDSIDSKHARQIDVITWTLSETNSGSFRTGGGGGTGKVDMKDFKVTMRTSKASPKLFLACAKGTHIKEVLLEVCKSAGDKSRFLNIKLSEVTVSSFLSVGNSMPGTADVYPVEEILFNFSKIEFSYWPVDAKGHSGGEIKSYWDVSKNQGG